MHNQKRKKIYFITTPTILSRVEHVALLIFLIKEVKQITFLIKFNGKEIWKGAENIYWKSSSSGFWVSESTVSPPHPTASS